MDSKEDDLGRAWHVQVLALDVGSVGSTVGRSQTSKVESGPPVYWLFGLGWDALPLCLGLLSQKTGANSRPTLKDAVVLSEVMTGQSVP